MGRLKRSFIAVFGIVFVLCSGGQVFAVDQSNPCPEGMTPADCQAITGNWPDYNPLSVSSCSTGGGSVGATISSSVPAVYATLFTNAASAANTNPNMVAAIFVTEHGNRWPNPAGPWASSGAGAQGPFQFLPGTWAGYKTDGDGDGKADIQSLADSAFAAAKYLAASGAKPDTPIGTLEKPFNPNSFTYIAGAYNAGGGTMESQTNPNMSLDDAHLSSEANRYIRNVFYLLTTDFKTGASDYGGGTVQDNTNGATTIPTASGDTTTGGSCSSSASADAAGIVKQAQYLAWPTAGHGKEMSDAMQTYQDTMPKEDGTGNGPVSSLDDDAWSDCGVFVATVMHSTKADPAWPRLTTGEMLNYAKKNPDKYEVKDSFSTSKDLLPGDILVMSGHIYIYVGPNDYSKKTVAEASHHDHVPEFDADPYPSQDGENFAVVRMK